MGQYREWRYYRELDQQFQVQRAQLEQDLQDLQAQARALEVHDDHAHNKIIDALQRHISSPEPVVASSPSMTESTAPPPPTTDTEVAAAYLSQTATTELATWQIPAEANLRPHAPAPEAPAPSPLPSIPAIAPFHLPAYINYFTDQDVPAREADEPVADSAHPVHKALPVDQQSKRTDQLILRWFERWGKLPQETHATWEGAPNE